MTEEEILDTLDNSNDGYYCSFVDLGHAYSYLIDARITVFRGDCDRWAIAVERLGYNPGAGAIILDINYYGNCLTNLDFYNDRPTNCYRVYPIDSESFTVTMDGETLRSDATFWLVREQQVSLSHNIQDYTEAGIELKAYEPNEICGEEVGRLVVSQNRHLFRATEAELYKSIPSDLRKILVLDEWFHKDFQLHSTPTMTDEHLRETFELNKDLRGLGGQTFEHFTQSFWHQEMLNDEWNREQWEQNRPSSYETWKLIAKVIVTTEPGHYKPTVKPNTHWTNWPESGSM